MNQRLRLTAVLIALLCACRPEPPLPEDRAALLALTDDPDLEIAVLATNKLAGKYGEAALLEALKTRGPTGRGWAAAALGKYPSHATREALVTASSDESADVRFKVAASLGLVGDQSCVAALKRLSTDSDEKVRLFASQSLQRLESAIR